MPGTHLAYGTLSGLRYCYGTPGTYLPYSATRNRYYSAMVRGTLVASCLMSYAFAMRCPVLTKCIALRIC
eukprot:2425516-Rhodomonas_salina.3